MANLVKISDIKVSLRMIILLVFITYFTVGIAYYCGHKNVSAIDSIYVSVSILVTLG